MVDTIRHPHPAAVRSDQTVTVAAEQLSKSSRWCSPKRERTLAGGVCFLSDPAIARKGWERHERLFDIYVQKLRKEAVKLLE